MLIRYAPMKSRKRLARDVFDTFALFMMSLMQSAGHKEPALTSSQPERLLG